MKELILRHKLFFGTIIFLVLLVIPLTVFQVQQQQELRQRALENPKVGIRLCRAEPLNPITNISACNNEVRDSSFLNYPVQIVAVNNSVQDVGSIDVSSFDLELQYDSRAIKYLSVDNRNDSNYKIILPSVDRDLAVPGDTRKTIRIVGVNNTSIPRNVEQNGVLTLAFIHVEPKSDSSSTGIEILSNNTKVAVKGTRNNSYSHLPNGLLFAKNIPAVTGGPTATPTLTQTVVAPTATPTLAPTPTPTLAPTPTPDPGSTQLSFSLKFQNIGNNPGENNNPIHKTRIVYLWKHGAGISLLSLAKGEAIYDSTNGIFVANISSINSDFQPGSYRATTSSQGYLRRSIPNSITINPNRTIPPTAIGFITLFSGDINDDNFVNILDYTFLRDCFGNKANTPTCKNKVNSDLNDDGVVDGVDYNAFIKGLSEKEGD